MARTSLDDILLVLTNSKQAFLVRLCLSETVAKARDSVWASKLSLYPRRPPESEGARYVRQTEPCRTHTHCFVLFCMKARQTWCIDRAGNPHEHTQGSANPYSLDLSHPSTLCCLSLVKRSQTSTPSSHREEAYAPLLWSASHFAARYRGLDRPFWSSLRQHASPLPGTRPRQRSRQGRLGTR